MLLDGVLEVLLSYPDDFSAEELLLLILAAVLELFLSNDALGTVTADGFLWLACGATFF